MRRENIAAESDRSMMRRRRITLPDGRYLIFYTFEDGQTQIAEPDESQTSRVEPKPVPVAEEEHGV
jgi:hypothetical protein